MSQEKYYKAKTSLHEESRWLLILVVFLFLLTAGLFTGLLLTGLLFGPFVVLPIVALAATIAAGSKLAKEYLKTEVELTTVTEDMRSSYCNKHISLSNNNNEIQNNSHVDNSSLPKPKSQKVLIFQLNEYSDGHGDMGNLIDFSKKMIDLLGEERFMPYFVIFSRTPEKSLNRFKTSMPFVGNDQIFTFKIGKTVKVSPTILFDNATLKLIYENADAVYSIATPFNISNQELKKYLKPEVEVTTVTEHTASSYITDWNMRISSPPNHYVTGIGDNYSGMMVTDLSPQVSSAETLLSISDQSYFIKLGLTENPPKEAAERFLQTTLVVPVYLGATQVELLRPILDLILNSELAKKYPNVVFHINSAAYDQEHFDFYKDDFPLTGSELPKYQMIIGHYFENPSDYEKIYQLSPNGGAAVCSGDKTLELTVSTGLLPLYVPPIWKRSMSNTLIDYVGKDTNHGKLLEFLGFFSKITDKPMQVSPDFLSQETCQNWRTNKRPNLLENSFYHVMEKEFVPRLLGNSNSAEKALETTVVQPSVLQAIYEPTAFANLKN